jgi:hypothetical protein
MAMRSDSSLSISRVASDYLPLASDASRMRSRISLHRARSDAEEEDDPNDVNVTVTESSPTAQRAAMKSRGPVEADPHKWRAIHHQPWQRTWGEMVRRATPTLAKQDLSEARLPSRRCSRALIRWAFLSHYLTKKQGKQKILSFTSEQEKLTFGSRSTWQGRRSLIASPRGPAVHDPSISARRGNDTNSPFSRSS